MHGIHLAILQRQAIPLQNTDYHFTDNTPGSGYYRIAEYDADGTVAYSSILHAGCAVSETLKIWPNPAVDICYLSLPVQSNATVTIQLSDSKGALIKQQLASLVNGNNLISINVRGLASGIYYVSIISTNGEVQMKKLLKQ